MNRAEYQVYVDHFNNKRYDDLTSYFTPDITVEYYDDATYRAPAKTLHGRDGFTASYKTLHSHTREVLELGTFISEGKLLFAELYTEFHTFKDTQGPPPRKQGDIQLMTNWVLYDLDDAGKMKRIRIAHFRMHDPKTAKYK
jgi:hypothetical protein